MKKFLALIACVVWATVILPEFRLDTLTYLALCFLGGGLIGYYTRD